MNNDVWLGLLARGVLWTCGKLTDEGTPMPGYEGTGIKPIVLPKPSPKPDPKFQKGRGKDKNAVARSAGGGAT